MLSDFNQNLNYIADNFQFWANRLRGCNNVPTKSLFVHIYRKIRQRRKPRQIHRRTDYNINKLNPWQRSCILITCHSGEVCFHHWNAPFFKEICMLILSSAPVWGFFVVIAFDENFQAIGSHLRSRPIYGPPNTSYDEFRNWLGY